ncbi:unnamed protein product [Alternaria alternata]
MLRRTIPRATARPPRLLRRSHQRRYATEPIAPPASSQSRIERFNRRLPRFLHKYTNALGNAPVTHITSFLILHELTAIIPLFGLAGYFHYTHWLPPWFAEGAWIASGVERFGRYFKRKGWIRSDEALEAEREVDEIQKDDKQRKWMKGSGLLSASDDDGIGSETKRLRKVDQAWNISEGGVRLVVEFATAYTIVKMFLIPRIVFSVWATPTFARWTVSPFLKAFRGMFRKKGKSTEAVKGGAAPKTGSGKISFQPNTPTSNMCFSDDDYSYESRFEVRNGRRYYAEDYHPRFDLPKDWLSIIMEAYPKPRHQYIYNPRYGQRGLLTYAGQAANGAAPTGVVGGGFGYGGFGGVGVGMGVGYGVGAYQPAVYNARPLYPQTYATNYYPPNYSYPSYGGVYGYYNYNLYGSLYPLANFYYPYQRTYYNTVPTYGYTAHVYPPGPTTTTTTYHVTNSQAQNYSTPVTQTVRETRPAYVHSHAQQGPTREDIQMESRRIATERGSYDPRKIRPADARDDDPFWCREVNGEWHLRSSYQIENECHPGRWMMDADIGFLVFHRA